MPECTNMESDWSQIEGRTSPNQSKVKWMKVYWRQWIFQHWMCPGSKRPHWSRMLYSSFKNQLRVGYKDNSKFLSYAEIP